MTTSSNLTPALPFARRLRRGQFVRFPRPHALCLRAERGTLWVTVDGEPDDIELNAGTSRVFDGPALVLVSSLGGDAVVSATPLQRPSTWQRALQRLQGWLGLPAAVVVHA